MIKLLQSTIKGKYCSSEDVVSLKWLLVPETIDFIVLKMTFKGLLNERMPSNFQISIKEKKRELRTATEITKLTLTSDPHYKQDPTTSHILSNIQQHHIMKFQNQYKELKNIVLLLLS